MPCKIPVKSSGETHRNIWKRKTKYVCVVDADESTRARPEGAGHKPHQDHITAKVLKLTKLVENHLQGKQQNPFLQRFRKVKIIRKRHWNTSFPYRHKQSLIRKPSTTRRKKSCVQVATSSDECISFNCDKFLHRIESDCI